MSSEPFDYSTLSPGLILPDKLPGVNFPSPNPPVVVDVGMDNETEVNKPPTEIIKEPNISNIEFGLGASGIKINQTYLFGAIAVLLIIVIIK